MEKHNKGIGDSLFRLGIDFHWHSWEKVGERFDPEQFKDAMESVKTRFVILMAKCELGWTYYPTKIGIPHPKLKYDYFGTRVKILKNLGYKVIAYYCIGEEGKILQEHPDWKFVQWGILPSLCSDEDSQFTSCESPYLDKIVLPQLSEIISGYPVDGIWLDIYIPGYGVIDFNPVSAKRFKKRMGRPLTDPAKDPNLTETWKYFRKRGMEILKQIYDYIHNLREDVLLAANHMYTPRTPYLKTQYVDYLSADPTTPSCGNSFQIGWMARFFAQTGLDAEIHGTSYRQWGEWDHKEVSFMQRETAISLASGANYVLWENHYPTGAIDNARWERVKKVEKFIEDRRECFTLGYPIGDILVLCTVASYENEACNPHSIRIAEGPKLPPNLDGRIVLPMPECITSAYGASALLQNSARSFVLSHEGYFEKQIKYANVIVLPRQRYISEQISEKVKKFVNNGGILLVFGSMPENLSNWTKLYTSAPDPIYPGYVRQARKINSYFKEETVCVRGEFFPIKGEGACILNYIRPDAYYAIKKGKIYRWGFSAPGYEEIPACLLKKVGKGTVVLCGIDIFQSYYKIPTALVIDIMDYVLLACGYKPRIETSPKRGLEVVERTDGNRYIVHFINLLESNNNPATAVYLPPLRDIEVKISCSSPPKEIYLYPDRKKVKFTWKDGYIKLKLDKIDIHCALEILGFSFISAR